MVTEIIARERCGHLEDKDLEDKDLEDKDLSLTLGYSGNRLLPNISVSACLSVRRFCWVNGHGRWFE